MKTQTNKITETTHPKEGYLPRKMLNWPKNIEAAKALADKYDELADDGVCTYDTLSDKTGFGRRNTCTLCAAVEIALFVNCNRCIHMKPYAPHCVEHPTYDALTENTFAPDALRDRAAYLRDLISIFE